MGKTGTPGETLHADWFGAWDEYTQSRWENGCINGALSGVSGDLCDGGRMPDAGGGGDATRLPRLAPIPPMPSGMDMSSMQH